MSDDGTIVFGGDSTDIPPGTYPATVSGITTKQSTAFGDFRAWDFTLENGSIVGGATSMSTNTKSKGGRWVVAILGRKPEQGEAVNLIGRSCLVQVIVSDDGWPKVDAVLSPVVGAGTPATAAEAVTPEKAPASAAPQDALPF